MSGQLSNSIGSIAVVAALLVSGLGVDLRTHTARANDCLAAPNASAPQDQHWYYRSRPNDRKCWYLKRARTPAASSPQMNPVTAQVRAAQDGATRPQTKRQEPTHSIDADRKTRGSDPSGDQRPAVMNNQEKEAIFQGFLEWQKAHRVDANATDSPSDDKRPAVISDQEKEALFREFLAWQKARRLNDDVNR